MYLVHTALWTQVWMLKRTKAQIVSIVTKTYLTHMSKPRKKSYGALIIICLLSVGNSLKKTCIIYVDIEKRVSKAFP